MKENDLRKRIKETLIDYANYDNVDFWVDEILHEIGTCGECKHLIVNYDKQPYCGLTSAYKDPRNDYCSHFERREK